MTLGDLWRFTAFLAFLVAPVFQMVGIGTQITEALAGLDRTQEVLREKPEDEEERRTRPWAPFRATSRSSTSASPTTPASLCCLT